MDLQLKTSGGDHHLPVSCKECPYTVCHVCFVEWMAKDEDGVIPCPDCEDEGGFNTAEPDICPFACLLLSEAQKKPTAAAAPSVTRMEPATEPPRPKVQEKAVAVVTPPPKTKKRKQDDISSEAQPPLKAQSAASAPAKSTKKKPRKKKPAVELKVSTEELEQLANYVIDVEEGTGRYQYLLDEGESEKNIKNVVRQVKKFLSGDGIPYKNWPDGVRFMEDNPVNLSMDFDQLHEEAKAFEKRYGKDKGNGWLLLHPITKLGNYKRYVLEEKIRK